MAKDVMGSVYILHFDRPYHHARHYLGWSSDPVARFDRHTAGQGSPLVRAAVRAGIGVSLVSVRPGTRHDERRLHIHGHVAQACPLCRQPRVRKSNSRVAHIASEYQRTRCGFRVEAVKYVTRNPERLFPNVAPCKRCFKGV